MTSRASTVNGFADTAFRRVADAFRRNFVDGGELGAAVSVVRNGTSVVDLWGGIADRRSHRAWDERTAVVIFSCTKGVMAIAAYQLFQDGRLDLDARVDKYWPEYATKGKESTTVRMLLSHRAGVPVIDEPLTREQALAWRPVISAIEHQRPLWAPGTAHTYHAKTFGWLIGEVIRRITGRTPGEFVAERLTAPLGLELWIGLPVADQDRVARTEPPPGPTGPGPDWSSVAREVHERAVTLNGTFPFPDRDGDVTFNDPDIRAAELPGGNGISTARSLARLYGACVREIDGIRLLSDESITDALVEQSIGPQLFGSPIGGFRWGTGFQLNAPPWCPMLGRTSFGHDGAGGQLAFADAQSGVGFAYLTNQMGGPDDHRTQRLIAALEGSLKELDEDP
jgi:CubicO group peptidase (beta-lactamase class C family)